MRLVVDSSVLLALLFDEPERESFHRALLANEALISIVSIVETYSVTRGRLGTAALSEIDLCLETYEIEVASVQADDLAGLRRAMLEFGKGRSRPPAVLNFGDLFAYALARRLDLPLLSKGDDFGRTDVRRALA